MKTYNKKYKYIFVFFIIVVSICFSLSLNFNSQNIHISDSALKDFLQENDISYPNPFSLEYPNENTVPSIIKYHNDTIYYTSYEESIIKNQYDSSQTPENIEVNLFSYNIKTREKVNHGNLQYENLLSHSFVFSQKDYYYFPLKIENDGSVLYLRSLNLHTSEDRTLEEIYNSNIDILVDIEDNTIIFLVNYHQDSVYAQRIYRLILDESIECIYDSVESASMFGEYSALDIHEGNIYLLKQTVNKDKLVTSIEKMSFDGQILDEYYLPFLDEYFEPNYYADRLYYFGDYCFIKWYNCGDELPYFIAYHINQGKFEKIEYANNAPCYLLYDKPIENRYLYFSTFPDDMDYNKRIHTSTLKVFDLQTNKFMGLTIPFPEKTEITGIVCNEKGNLILTTQTNTNDLYNEYGVIYIDNTDILKVVE